MATTSLSVNPETLIVTYVNGTADLKVTTNASTYTITSAKNYVTFTNNSTGDGKLVTGGTAGEDTITITAQADGGEEVSKTLRCIINDDKEKPIITVDKAELAAIVDGEEQIITLTTNAKSFVAVADNDNVTVTEVANENKVKVQGKKAGSAVITITAEAYANSGTGLTKDVTVNVTVKETPTLSVTPTTATFKANKKQAFVVTTNQSDYGYVINPSDLATYDKTSNQLTGVRAGTGTITFYVNKDQVGELSQEVAITIEEPDVTTLVVTPTAPTVTVGGSVVFTVTTNASDYNVTNSNPTISTFDKGTATLQALATGSTALTFTAKYGEGQELTTTVNVTIEEAPVEPITLDVTPNVLTTAINGDKINFNVNTNADDYTVTLSNNGIATFDKATGVLTTTGVGNLTVTIEATKEGTENKKVEVPVTIMDTTLTISATTLTVNKGGEVSFDIVSNIPTEVKLVVDDETKIAIAKNNTKVTVDGLLVGNANIVVTARDKVTSIPVKVIDTTNLVLSATPKVVYVGRAAVIEVTTNAPSFTYESSDPAIVTLTKINNTITVTGFANGTSTLTFTAQVEGGDLETVTWEITSIKESSYTRDEADKILTDATTTVEDKILAFSNDVGEIGKFVNNMTTYNTVMDPNAETTLEDEKGAAKNYSLYILIKDAIEDEDYAEFKTKFDIINMVFTTYAKSAFDEFALFRYDQAWMNKWGETSLYTFQNLCTLICSLCAIKTRTANLSGINLDTALDTTKIELTETAVNNIKKYYTV